jgi:pimeloyl-ACP methyl ester carboxylesterase
MIEALKQFVNDDEALVRRGRFLTTTFLLEVGQTVWLIAIFEGRIVSVTSGPFVMPSSSFALRAAEAEWEKFWSCRPPPGSHDLMALIKRHVLRVDGNLQIFMANLRYFKEALAKLRATGAQTAPARAQAALPGSGGVSVAFEPIIGRYMHLDLLGRAHRIYLEQAGEGTPLLCLHTAGSDGRQYRALMNDARITSRHRVIVFDMPWHGKSSPPSGWHDEEYQLTSAQYTTMILEIMTALELDRPILIGCSIGGRIALHLALEHPEAFRAIIGLQAGAHVDPYYDLNFLHRPDVHGGEVCAAVVSGLVGPDAPDDGRWETLWHYMQGGPGVFKGDLHFYKLDGDIRGRVAQIDTSRCPLFLLSGEYDYSCTPEETLGVATSIPGCEVTIMKGLGHFPMSENPAEFLKHLLPVLEKIGKT